MKKSYRLPILEIGKPNKNNRIYTKGVLLEAIEKFNKNPCNVGQFEMPDTGHVSLVRISHVVKKLYIEDNFLMADIEMLDNENGNRLIPLIDSEEVVFRFCSRTKRSQIVNKGQYHIPIDLTICSVNAIRAENAP